ncbi:MAG: transposase [Deltaproteobacteria bacterium]|nr:transposase [Deltaproteobacteria bacterium]
METIAINQSNNGRGDPSAAKTPDISPPDSEVTGKRLRRKFTAKYKLRMLKKAEACTGPGQLGSLLRQEGLYSSNLTTWRKQRDEGLLIAMAPKKRGRKAQPKNPLGLEVARLQKENQRLKNKLKQAELIIDAQKKISEILGIAQNHDENERGNS